MTSGSFRRVAATAGVVAAGVTAWSTLIEPRLFTLRRHTLPVLPDGAAPVRVLQLSDLHLAPWQHRKIEWVRSLVELAPDLVVLTGDLMGHAEARPDLLRALEPFGAADVPVVFVYGSNDYYGPRAKNPMKYLQAPSRLHTREPDIDTDRITRAFTDQGFIDLNNAATRITIRGTEFDLFGLNDPHVSFHDIPAMRTAIGNLPPAAGVSAPVRLGVVHAPYQEALGALLDEEASVIFAGHTHGGQVRVPFAGALTANCDLPTDQARGLSVWFDAEHAAYLNVSAGLGASIYSPVRFCCRPEASLLTLEPPR
ncbi:metallophosphoesterase [Leucobacter sp. Psy1]|uniref:metallophosphoesterase n=1 Tax=Leucobacter sp. Psy1 TaxID=2875729 RepID=UPI001CD2B1F7|nr:metallophosphoesterase [Leucobacter sp. Psy1]UBH06985.1 metallophosphoesterase [Leucobacter sp. Psy1]